MNVTTLQRCTIGLLIASALLALYVAQQALVVASAPQPLAATAPR